METAVAVPLCVFLGKLNVVVVTACLFAYWSCGLRVRTDFAACDVEPTDCHREVEFWLCQTLGVQAGKSARDEIIDPDLL